jgi:hypothetical protein
VAQFELLLQRTIGRHAVVHPPRQIADLGVKRAAHGDIDLLEPAADRKERLPPLDAGPHQRQHDGVAGPVEGAMRLGRGFAVLLGMHVRAPAGQQKAVEPVEKLVDRDKARIGRDQKRKRARHETRPRPQFIVPPAWAGY